MSFHPPTLSYDHLADIFARAFSETRDLADAFRVVDVYRMRLATAGAEADTFSIIEATARRFGVHARRILRRDRHRSVCDARWTIVQILHARGLSSVQIGTLVGLDHSSVLHALAQLRNRPDLLSTAQAVLADVALARIRETATAAPCTSSSG